MHGCGGCTMRYNIRIECPYCQKEHVYPFDVADAPKPEVAEEEKPFDEDTDDLENFREEE